MTQTTGWPFLVFPKHNVNYFMTYVKKNITQNKINIFHCRLFEIFCLGDQS